MFSWLNSPEQQTATWNDTSTIFLEKFKCITYSTIDHEERPIIYTNVPSVPIGGKGFGVDFDPITFLSCFTIHTHKGINSLYNFPCSVKTLTCIKCKHIITYALFIQIYIL